MPRPRMLLLLALLGAAVIASPAAAEEPVFLRGYRVTHNSTVFGGILGVSGDTARINLGYAHGVDPGDLFLAIRMVDGLLVPVCGLTVTTAHASSCSVRLEGPFRARTGDFVLTRADQLDLWGATPRMERLARERLARRTLERGYNTFDISPELIDELGRDDEYQRTQHRTQDWEAFVLAAAGRTETYERRIGAVEPEPLLAPTEEAELAAAAADRDPTIGALSTFAALGRDPDQLIPRLDLDRLRQLEPLDRNVELTEITAPLLRNVLLTWTRKVLKNPTETFQIAPPPPARTVTVPY